MAFLWALLPNDGIAFVADWFVQKVSQLFIDLPYSRLLETEADEVGLAVPPGKLATILQNKIS